MTDWRPIETAPKDGRSIVVFNPSRGGCVADQRYLVVHWVGWGGGIWEASTGMGKYDDYELSHWMPLPPPPQ